MNTGLLFTSFIYIFNFSQLHSVVCTSILPFWLIPTVFLFDTLVYGIVEFPFWIVSVGKHTWCLSVSCPATLGTDFCGLCFLHTRSWQQSCVSSFPIWMPFSLLCLIAPARTCSAVLEQGAQCGARPRLLDLRRSASGLAPPCTAHRARCGVGLGGLRCAAAFLLFFVCGVFVMKRG